MPTIEFQPMPEVKRRLNTSERRELVKIARSNTQMGPRTVIVQPGDDIQVAIDSLNNSGGGTVFLKAGTHTLTRTLTGYSNVSIAGEGLDQSIIECGGNAYGLSYVGTLSALLTIFSLKDFTLQNSNNTAGIDIQYADSWNIDAIKVTSCDQKGIRIQDAKNFLLIDVVTTSNTGNGIEIAASNNRATEQFSLINCQSNSNAINGYAINPNTNDMFYGRFISCQAASNTSDGFDFSGSGASALDITLAGCVSNANGGIGYDVDSSCQRVSFVGCYADVNTGDGFEISAVNCRVVGCFSSDPVDLQNDTVFIGNSVAGGSSTDPIGQIITAEGSTQSFLNQNEGTRTTRRYIIMKNTVGTTIAAGSPVILNSVATGDEVVTTTTGGDDKVFGMADEAISNNAWGRILIEGYTTRLRANGTTDIAIGDLLTTDTNAGIAKKGGVGDMIFGMALEAYSTDDTSGVLNALIFSPRLI